MNLTTPSNFKYNDKQKHKILVVDDSKVILKSTSYMLSEHNYSIYNAMNGKEALEKLQEENIDIVITDINMPKLGGFSLIENINKLSPNIPYIMMTDSDIDNYLELAIKNNVGNILSKPLEKSELLTTVYKLLYPKTLFGLSNYLNINENNLNTIYIKSSKECENAIPTIIQKAQKININPELLSSLKLILNELAINAVYHPHGFTKEKEERKLIKLDEGDEIQIQYGYNNSKFGVSITDFQGKLTKITILSSFKKLFDANKKMMNALAEGKDPTNFIQDKGRGLQIAREMSNEYYFNIKKNKITQLIILSWLGEMPQTRNSYSIKINEL